MADTQDKTKGKKPDKAERAPKPEKGDKGQQAKPQKGDKGEKPAKGEAPEKAPAPKAKKPEVRVTPRLKTHFEEVVRKQLTEQFSYRSRMQVPMIDKVVINMGIGEGVADRKKVVFDDDIVALVDDEVMRDHERIKFVSLDVHSGSRREPSAELELEVDGVVKSGAAVGDGPVGDAALNQYYSLLQDFRGHRVGHEGAVSTAFSFAGSTMLRRSTRFSKTVLMPYFEKRATASSVYLSKSVSKMP